MARRTGRPSYLADKPDERRRRTARIVAVAGAIALVTALLGGLVGYQVGRPDATAETIASIQEADAKRDAQQIVELTETARRVRDQVAPVLTAVKEEKTAGRAPDPGRARTWQDTMRKAAEPFADPPSGSTATNVARGVCAEQCSRRRSPSTPTPWPPVSPPPTRRHCWTSARGRRPRRPRSGRSRRPSSTRSASTPVTATSTCSWTQTP